MNITNGSSRLVALATGVAVAIALMGAVAVAPAQAQAALTQAQIQSIVSLLASFGADSATIANVTAALNGQATPGTGTPSTGGACPALTRDLQQGSTGADVMALQKFLNGSSDTMVSVSGAGSPGNETSTFGPATKAAVMKFQSKHSISPVAGYVGALSRAKIASVCGSVTPGPGPVTPGAVNVSAGAQPVNSLAPAGASRVPFTTFTVSNNSASAVTINSVTVQRVGLGVDANFSGVVLVDQNGLQVGNAKTLNSNHQANLDGFTLNAGQSMTFTVVGNIANSSTAQQGQVVGLQVVAINTGATVSGSLPISGASQTINTTLSLGSVSTTTSSFDPGAAQSKNLGDTAVRFSGLRFTAGSVEDLRLYSIRWRQVGTASASDISNVMTNVSGTNYPTTVSSDGKYYTTTFPGGILVTKGSSIDVYVQGDITGSNSASRTVDMDIDRSTDVYFIGQTYGYGVAVTGTATPWFTGYVTTINAGSATTISKATEVAAQNIAVNVPNQPLGGFVTDFKGEAVSITGMKVTFATSSASTGLLTSVSIVDANGTVVAGPVDTTWVSGVMTATFTDSITFPASRKVYTIKGKIPSDASNGAVVTASTVPSSTWTSPTGQTSGNTITLSQGSFSMNAMTVKSAALTIAVSATPTSQNIVAGAQNVTFINVQLDATQSGEDVRLSALPIRLTVASGAAVGDLSSCQLFNGATALNTGSNVPSSLSSSGSATTFTFDNSLTIPKGTVVTLTLKCNVSSSGTGTYVWSINSGDTFNSTGITSGNSITESVTTTSSGTMTVATGSLAVSVDSSSPSYMLAAGGQTGVTMGIFKFRASNEAINLTKLGLTLTGGTSTSSADLIQVYVYDGATLVGTALFSGTNTTATSSLSTTVSLPKDTDKILTIKADLADIGTSQPGFEGALIKIDPLNAEGTGASAGTVVTDNADTGVAGVRVYNTYPTVALDTLGSTGLADGRLMRFKVTANSANSLGIGEFTFTIATTTAIVTNIQLFGYTDASYSNAISGQGTSGQIGSTVSTTNASAFALGPSTNPVQVPAGETRYFELRASISGVTTGASAVTTLGGDSSGGPVTGTAQFATGLGAFIWSPNATGTAATTSGNDWTNGYGVAGLPAGGLFQTRGN